MMLGQKPESVLEPKLSSGLRPHNSTLVDFGTGSLLSGPGRKNTGIIHIPKGCSRELTMQNKDKNNK